MFESIKNKIEESNKDSSPKNMSFDFKLMFVYHISMMVLFGLRPINNAKDQMLFALMLSIVLVLISIVHKLKSKWSWPGLSILSIPAALFNFLLLYVLFAVAAYAMNPSITPPELQLDSMLLLLKDAWPVILNAISIPVFTPWYLAGIGIVAFNILTSLKLVSLKKTEFEAQCKNS